MSNWTKDAVLESLKGVVEPELGKDIVSLDLVELSGPLEGQSSTGQGITVQVKSSNPAMHARKRMQDAVEFALERGMGTPVECEVEVIPLQKEERTLETRKVLPGVQHVIAVASGKGGVGKSTVSSNIAVALAQLGYRVGLVDADIHGPSVPTMFDVVGAKPQPVEVEGGTKIQPIEQYGVKVLSMGFFADQDQAIVWRGPMASRALSQLFTDAEWGELDFMVVDLPPGTGDIHLSLVQQIPLSGAVIVSTPQDVALADARKGVGMFRLEDLKVPVLGLIENMAYFVPPDLPEKKYHIFGRDGVKRLADSLNAPFLGELPLLQTIREAGDAGRPAVLQTSGEAAAAFRAVVAKLLQQLGKDV